MRRVMLVSWWATLKSLKSIDCLTLSYDILLSEELCALMRNLWALSCWMLLLIYYRMVPSILLMTPDHLFLFSAFGPSSRTLLLFQLGCQPLFWNRLDSRSLFRLVLHLLLLKLFLPLIDLLQSISVHPFLVYLDGLIRWLKMLILRSMTSL